MANKGDPGVVVHAGQRQPRLRCEPGGIGILGRDDEVLAVEASDLDPASPVGKLYLYEASPGGGAPHLVVTDAQGPRLPHQEPGHTFEVPREDECTGLVGATAALHEYRLQPGVEGPGGEDFLHGGPEELSRGVVN